MDNAIAHHPEPDAHTRSQAAIPPPPSQFPSYILSMTSYGIEYPLGWFGSAVLAVPSPSFL